MDMWTLCEKYPAYYNLQHSVSLHSEVPVEYFNKPLHTYTLNLSSQEWDTFK